VESLKEVPFGGYKTKTNVKFLPSKFWPKHLLTIGMPE